VRKRRKAGPGSLRRRGGGGRSTGGEGYRKADSVCLLRVSAQDAPHCGSHFQLSGGEPEIGFSRVSKPREGEWHPHPPFFELAKKGPILPSPSVNVTNK